MSKKNLDIAALIETCRGGKYDAHYLGYFECFNRGLFYESHDVLEELWLGERTGPNGAFYKGLIQFAGAFVHLQKGRLRPAAALFKLADRAIGASTRLHQYLKTCKEWPGTKTPGTPNPRTKNPEPGTKNEP